MIPIPTKLDGILVYLLYKIIREEFRNLFDILKKSQINIAAVRNCRLEPSGGVVSPLVRKRICAVDNESRTLATRLFKI